MNNEGWLILLIPLLGLVPIFRGGRFRWKVVPFSAALSGLCWFGWCAALVVGILVLFGE